MAELSKQTRLKDLVSDSSPKYDIGVSRKCCPACWELGNVLRAHDKLDIVLPDHHSMYYPWIPPPQLSDEVERTLLNALKDMFQKAHDRSHLSSPATSDTGGADNDSDWKSVVGVEY